METCLYLIIGYTSWAFAGHVPALLFPVVGLAVIMLIMLLRDRGRRAELLRDPVFYLAAVFLTLLLLQWINAGLYSSADPDGRVWLGRDIPTCIPFSVVGWEAWEMIAWFLPAFAIILAVRHAYINPSRLIRVVLINGAALAVVGIIQELCKAHAMFWFIPFSKRFFATFQYENSAGDYFFLLFCLAMSRRQLVLAALFAWAVWLAGCNATTIMLLIPGLILVSLPMLIKIKSKKLVIIFCCLAGALGGATGLWLSDKTISYALADRWWQIIVNFKVWQQFPIFGTGGWGCRYFPSLVATMDQQALLAAAPNNHCDPVQFLAEFGLIGTACLAGTLVILIRTAWRNHASIAIAIGLTLVFIHSTFDCPFRSPAVLFLWITMLTISTPPAPLTQKKMKNRSLPPILNTIPAPKMVRPRTEEKRSNHCDLCKNPPESDQTDYSVGFRVKSS